MKEGGHEKAGQQRRPRLASGGVLAGGKRRRATVER